MCLGHNRSIHIMTGQKNLLELALSKGFKLASKDDPIYKEGWIVSVNPSNQTLENPSNQQEEQQDSR